MADVPAVPSNLLFAASDPLITLLIFALFVGGSALMNWLKRRQQRAEMEREAAERARRGEQSVEEMSDPSDYAVEADSVPMEEAPAASQPRARSWEEELKRLLEGDFANPPPTSRPEPPPLPPVVIVPPHRVPSLPKPQPARSEPAPVLAPLPPIFSRGGQTEDAPSHETHEGYGHLSTLGQASKTYDRASHLSDLVAAKLAAMDSKTAFLPPETSAEHRRVRTREMVSVLKLLRTPTAARQVIIAQTVLGTPKGLET